MVSTLHSSISGRVALEWQRAWANSELGYMPSDEEQAILLDAQRRPEYYMEEPKRSRKPQAANSTNRKRQPKPYRLPFTIV
jgi:hypothetical protein